MIRDPVQDVFPKNHRGYSFRINFLTLLSFIKSNHANVTKLFSYRSLRIMLLILPLQLHDREHFTSINLHIFIHYFCSNRNCQKVKKYMWNIICSVLRIISNWEECYFRYRCILDDYSMQSDYEHEFKFTDLFGLSFVHISLDVSSNQVTFRIQEQWNDKYSDPTTKEYVNLKQQMAEEVNQIKQCFFFSNFSSPK